MAIPHANPGEVIDLSPLADRIASTKTYTVFKTPTLEAIRLVLPAGKQIAEHKAPGEITVQCLEGRVHFMSGGNTHELTPGKMLYLAAAEPHSLHAIEDSSILVTLSLR